MHPPSRMGSHTRLSGVLSYAAPSIPTMFPRATLAAALGQHYEIGATFTVTVTANGKVVPHVPFVNKGDQGSQMQMRFWKVSLP